MLVLKIFYHLCCPLNQNDLKCFVIFYVNVIVLIFVMYLLLLLEMLDELNFVVLMQQHLSLMLILLYQYVFHNIQQMNLSYQMNHSLYLNQYHQYDCHQFDLVLAEPHLLHVNQQLKNFVVSKIKFCYTVKCK